MWQLSETDTFCGCGREKSLATPADQGLAQWKLIYAPQSQQATEFGRHNSSLCEEGWQKDQKQDSADNLVDTAISLHLSPSVPCSSFFLNWFRELGIRTSKYLSLSMPGCIQQLHCAGLVYFSNEKRCYESFYVVFLFYLVNTLSVCECASV